MSFPTFSIQPNNRQVTIDVYYQSDRPSPPRLLVKRLVLAGIVFSNGRGDVHSSLMRSGILSDCPITCNYLHDRREQMQVFSIWMTEWVFQPGISPYSTLIYPWVPFGSVLWCRPARVILGIMKNAFGSLIIVI